MNKLNSLIYAFFAFFLFQSCSDTVSEEFEEINKGAEKKLIQSMTVTTEESRQVIGSKNNSIFITYDSDGKVSAISNNGTSTAFVFDGEQLKTVVGKRENFSIEELYESPYDAFDTGEVIEYDSNGNPFKIRFFEKEYDYSSRDYITYIYTAEVKYDDVPNPYFYTLEAMGIIDVLEGVELNYSLNPQLPEIVQARIMFPNNNPSKITYKDESGIVTHQLSIDYDYNNSNYPESAIATNVYIKDNKIATSHATYNYVD